MNRTLSLLTIGFYLLFQLFITRTGTLEKTIEPQKSIWLTQFSIGSRFTEEDRTEVQSIPFRIGDYFGFHDPDLNLLSYDVLQKDLPGSQNFQAQDFYLDYNEENQILIRDFLQREIGRFKGNQNAFVRNNYIFYLNNQRHTIEQYNREGKLLWVSSFPSYLNSLDKRSPQKTALGYLDGNIIIVDSNGKVENKYQVSGTRLNNLYGVAISKTGNYLAAIAGIDRQRFIFLEHRKGSYLFQYAKDLKDQLLHTRWLSFSENFPYVLYNANEGITVYNYKSKENRQYHIPGKLIDYNELQKFNIQFFIFQQDDYHSNLTAIMGSEGLFVQIPLEDQTNSLYTYQNHIYLGQKDLLVSYTLKEL